MEWKQDGFKCGTTVPGRRRTGRFGGEMTTTVEGKASDDRKPRRKGAVRGSITVSGKAYGEYRVTLVPYQHPAKAHKDWSQDSLPLQDDHLPDGRGCGT